LGDILGVDLATFGERIRRGALELNLDPPTDLAIEGWWEQARTLGDE
jgi:hypothetical protein